jgi:methylglyoxal synthase
VTAGIAAKRLALVAHDNKKPALAAWAARNRALLERHGVVATATTGGVLKEFCPDLDVRTVLSGPLGGDQQIGAMIAEGRIAALVFFPDAMTPMPHDVDVKALMRMAILYDVPFALNRATADLLVQAALFQPPAAETLP